MHPGDAHLFDEQKPGLLMTHLLSEFFLPNVIIPDVVMDSILTAKVCFMAQIHFTFPGCEVANAFSPKKCLVFYKCLLAKC